MRSTLRSLTFGLAATLAGALSAQYPYTVVVQGTIAGCVPFQQVNIATLDGAQPSYNYTLEVFPFFCTYDTILHFNSSSVGISVSTMCNGMLVTAYDSASFNFIGDTAVLVMDLACNGGGNYDCFGVLNGPNMPGTVCDDGNPMTMGDLWTPACVCAGQDSSNTLDCMGIPGGQNQPGTFCINFFGDSGVWSVDCICEPNTTEACQAAFQITSSSPWVMGLWNTSTGAGPMLYDWVMPDGSSSAENSPFYEFNAPGTYAVCLTIVTWDMCTSTMCDSVFVDTNGTVTTVQSYVDCLGYPNGPNVAGTSCTVPGTILEGTWSPSCVCVPDSSGFLYDCSGVLNGPDMPGMPCDDSNPATTNDTWNSACVCVGTSNEPCNADFWVIQAMGPDSLPVPYELWVWNLSSGGSGNFQFLWNFGDGTSSTEAFPTHTYDGNGPYVLCLTIVDNNACTSTHCDSISINGDGIYEGMIVHAEDRQEGFTINVQNPNANAVQEVVANNELALWPNPVVDELNVAVVSGMKGLVTVTITDLDGRTVKTERTSLSGGRSQLRIATSGLNAGMYLMRITDGSVNLSQRFVKTN